MKEVINKIDMFLCFDILSLQKTFFLPYIHKIFFIFYYTIKNNFYRISFCVVSFSPMYVYTNVDKPRTELIEGKLVMK